MAALDARDAPCQVKEEEEDKDKEAKGRPGACQDVLHQDQPWPAPSTLRATSGGCRLAAFEGFHVTCVVADAHGDALDCCAVYVFAGAQKPRGRQIHVV